MQSQILVINCGSSSLKFSVINPADKSVMLEGIAEQLQSPQGSITLKYQQTKQSLPLKSPYDHQAALDSIVKFLTEQSLMALIQAIGHRVVHGGEKFNQPTLLDTQVIDNIKTLSPLAPLHNPANVIGIEACLKAFPDLPQVAVFDTAFHQTLPQHAYLYGIPLELYQEHSIRKYGFHGTSHYYVVNKAAEYLNKPINQCNFISAHLGNGCSVTAVKQGQSVDTSLGMTPLEGLIMGTRSGDIDAGIIFDLAERLGYQLEEIKTLLNKQSGLLGLSGLSNDCRELEQAANEGNARASLALDIFAYKAAKTIASFAVCFNQLDGIIFTGGIGENSSLIREKITQHLALLHININSDTNNNLERGTICNIASASSIPCLIIPTNEELVIANQTNQLLSEEKRNV